jgi:hypothetical protein
VWKGKQLIPARWVAEATALQTSNGSAPTSDWDQGYGYQFWQSRHGYRGDGAYGQYMLVLPEQDAVIAITSGVRDMQAVMNLVWTKLLPAMTKGALMEDGVAQRALKGKLAGLSVRVASGRPTSPLSAQVSGRWYEVPDNDRGVRAIALDLKSASPALLVRSKSGDIRTPMGIGSWVKSNGFTNGINHLLSVPEQTPIAASGAWANDTTFIVKLVAPETPFYSIMTFRFEADRLVLDGEYNVNFGATKQPQLTGVLARP